MSELEIITRAIENSGRQRRTDHSNWILDNMHPGDSFLMSEERLKASGQEYCPCKKYEQCDKCRENKLAAKAKVGIPWRKRK